MSDFVNYGKRGIQLPKGCKDLIDVLQQPPGAGEVGASWGEMETFPSLESVATRGLDHVERQLARLVQSTAKFRSLLISSLDSRIVVPVFFYGKTLSVSLTVRSSNTIREPIIRMLFSQAGIQPFNDCTTKHKGVTVRMLEYALPYDAPAASRLIVDLLRRAFDISEEAGLVFHYHEKDSVPH